MIQRLFFTAIIAGIFAGIVITGVQLLQVKPLIAAAEVFEEKAQAAPAKTTKPANADTNHQNVNPAAKLAAPSQSPEQAASSHTHGDAWSPGDGIERLAYTLFANLILGVGFGLLLAAAFILAGGDVGLGRGALWGLGGFAAFSFIPGIGLPPEIPGMVAADLLTRQSWWAASVVASCLGLVLIVFGKNIFWRVFGGVVIVMPFVAGVPHLAADANVGNNLPPDLAAHFVTATFAANLIFWCVLGGVAGYVFEKLGTSEVSDKLAVSG